MSQFARKRIIEVEPLTPSSVPLHALTPPAGFPPAHTLHLNGRIIINSVVPAIPPTICPHDGCSVDSDSPGIHRTQSYDEALFDIRKVQPERIAAQLTLIDLPLFQAIRMDELANGSWTKKEKLQLAPNVVAFTRRFNHTSFWVVREILNEPNVRRRAEILTQFIKIAKKLSELNNLHSLKAVVAGLQSAPIYRLSHTWKSVPKKEKQTFDKLDEFLSDESNRKALRDHMNAAKLPCIPHLGMYLTDLTYLSTVSTARGGGAAAARDTATQVETIINMIVYCQNSTYDELYREQHIQQCLNHQPYIDGLQKFLEDENFKVSLKLEPAQVTKRTGKLSSGAKGGAGSQLRSSKSHEDLLTPFTSGSMDSLSQTSSYGSSCSHSDSHVWSTPQPQPRRLLTSRHTHHSLLDVESHLTYAGNYSGGVLCNGDGSVVQVTVEKSPSFSGTPSSCAPKRSTLPNNFRGSFSGSSSSSSFTALLGFSSSRTKSESEHHSRSSSTKLLDPARVPTSVKDRKMSSPTLPWRRHKKSQSLGTNAFTTMFGLSRPSPANSGGESPELPLHNQSRMLIDDSVMDETFTSYGTSTPTGSLENVSISFSSSSEDLAGGQEGEQLFKDVDDLSLEGLEMSTFLKEGWLRRKVVKRNGKSVTLRRTTKCFVQLTQTSLLLNNTSTQKQRKSSKPQKAKGLLLKECTRVKYREPIEKISDKQFIIIDDKGNHTKFIAKSSSLAQDWVEKIREAIAEERERERREVEKSLIKL